ncbi:M48 family metallopeptidase [Phytohabitans flavus]|uniref:M48 family metallopeptidase n=1 Tax=Phytohabitans flavus TaxID=1076124 RepID=UPI001E40E10D|nr:M48 family metallopeptidase [Phytohabitans flavus]
MSPLGGATCVECSAATVSVSDATPWCPSCEWQLDLYEPARRRPEFGWRWIDRRTHRLAYRLSRSQFDTLVADRLDRRGPGLARVVTIGISVLLLVLVALLAVFGVWLVVHDFPSLTIPFGLAALGLAATLRPRFGHLDASAEVLDRERAPALFELVDEVAAAVAAPAPDVVALDDGFNAYAGSVGLRRVRVLCIGLPAWGALPPQERVALLGHEMGHFVNGDVRRTLLTQPAFTMLGTAADLVRPVETAATGVERLGEMLVEGVQRLLARLLFGAHVLLVWLGQRDSQRAEYLADELAAKAGGSAAAASMLDAFLLSDAIEMVVRREARAGHGPDRWRIAADEARASAAASLPAMRQLSVRDRASLFASHPPQGLRSRMIRERQSHAAAVTLTEARLERIDSELTRHYERIVRDISWGG